MAMIPETHTTPAAPDDTTDATPPLNVGVVTRGPLPRPVIAFDRSLWMWVAICSVVMFVGVGAGVWAVTGRFIDGLAVSAFTTMWGGPGFGVMFGSAYHALSTERFERRTAKATEAGTARAH
jgi:hypothetical protein